MNTIGTINAKHSDILLKMQHSIVAYLSGSVNKFDGNVEMKNNEVEKASFEFSLNSNEDITFTNFNSKKNELKLTDFPEMQKKPIFSFKSTSFQKVNKHINFLKGELTINNTTKIVELDTEFIGVKVINGVQKALFEVTGEINRRDFNLPLIPTTNKRIFSRGKNIKLIANLEFDI